MPMNFCGRLTLDPVKPYLDADVTSSTLYYLPVTGCTVPIFDGSSFVCRSIMPSGVSASLAGMPACAFDVFAAWISGEVTLTFTPFGGQSQSQQKIAGGTSIGGLTASAGLAAAFNGNTSEPYTACASTGAASPGYTATNTIGKDWGAAKTVSSFKAYSANNDGFRGDGAAIGVKLQGWDGSSWIDLWAGTAPAGVAAVLNVAAGITSAACTKHQLVFYGNSTNHIRVCEVEFYEISSAALASRNLERQHGILVNAAPIGDIPASGATYLGSILIDEPAGQCTAHFSYGPRRKFGVWNAYNQATIILKAGIDSPAQTSPGAPAGSTAHTPIPAYPGWGPTANDAANSLIVFTGLKQHPVEVNYHQAARVTYVMGGGSSASQYYTGIGWDSIATPSGAWGQLNGENFSVNGQLVIGTDIHASYIAPPCEGAHVVTALESKYGYDQNAWSRENNMTLTARYMG